MKNKKRLTDKEIDEYYNIYKDRKINCKELSKIVNIEAYTLRRSFKRKGLILNYEYLNKSKKFTNNLDYFSKIDSSEKAYILGFLYADGYNQEQLGQIKISLHSKDEEILYKIVKELNINNPIKREKKKTRRGKETEQSSLLICSRLISKQLSKLGCFQNKSLTLKFPTEEQVPTELLPHFIRGYFDGDGCIFTKNKKINIVICSSNIFCLQFKRYISSNFNINFFISKTSNPKTNLLKLYKKNECIKFLEIIYDKSSIFLERKYQKYQQFLTETYKEDASLNAEKEKL